MVKSNVTAMPATKKRTKKERELRRKLKELEERARETDRRLDESLRFLDRLAYQLEARRP
jgi:hypothetical protein